MTSYQKTDKDSKNEKDSKKDEKERQQKNTRQMSMEDLWEKYNHQIDLNQLEQQIDLNQLEQYLDRLYKHQTIDHNYLNQLEKEEENLNQRYLECPERCLLCNIRFGSGGTANHSCPANNGGLGKW
jgi:hypothetical protein